MVGEVRDDELGDKRSEDIIEEFLKKVKPIANEIVQLSVFIEKLAKM